MKSLFHCLAAAFLCLGAANGSTIPRSKAGTGSPNVVLILADDLGIHDLGCYGRAEHRTPHVDRLALEGTRFTSAYCAQPICSPSRAALLTGRTPARLHLTTYLPGRVDAASQRLRHPAIERQLPLSERTLAEVLREAGYATACIGKWHLGGAGFGPGDRGFDFVHAGNANTRPTATEGGKGEFDLTAQAEGFMERNRDRPFFLYLAHHSPHIPYSAREDLVESNRAAFEPVYAAVVESLDASVGRLLARLDALQLVDKTIVIFTSDNGGLHVPELNHGRITHSGPFRAGKGFLYEGGLRVPLVVRWPGRIAAGRWVNDPVINTDWMPTLLDLCGLSIPGNLDGASLADLLLSRGRAPSRSLFWHFPHYTNQGGRPGGALRRGRWKYVELYDDATRELYDLETDPGETRDLASENPRRVARLARELADWRRAVGAQENLPNPACDEALFRALYLDFDPSRFAPARATAADWERVTVWRRGMDEAVRRK